MDLELDIYKNSVIENFIQNSIGLFDAKIDENDAPQIDDNNDDDKTPCIYLTKDINKCYIESIISIVDSNYVSEASVTMTEGSLEKDEDSLEYQLEEANDNGEIPDNIANCDSARAEDKEIELINITQSENVIEKADLTKTESLEHGIDATFEDDIDEANYFDCEDSGFNDHHNANTDDTTKSDQNSSQVSEMNSPELKAGDILMGTDNIVIVIDDNDDQDENSHRALHRPRDSAGQQLVVSTACTPRASRDSPIAASHTTLTNDIRSAIDCRQSSSLLSADNLHCDIMDLNEQEFASSSWLYSVDTEPGPGGDQFDIESAFSFSTMKLATIEPQMNAGALSLLSLHQRHNGWIYDSCSSLMSSFPDKLERISPIRQFASVSPLVSSTPCKNPLPHETLPKTDRTFSQPMEFLSNLSPTDLDSSSVVGDFPKLEPMEDSFDVDKTIVPNREPEPEETKPQIAVIPTRSLMKRPTDLSKSAMRIPSANRSSIAQLPRETLSPKCENDVLIRASGAQFDSGRRHTVVEISPKELANNSRAPRPQSMIKFGDFKAPSAIGKPLRSLRASVSGLKMPSELVQQSKLQKSSTPNLQPKPGLKAPTNIPSNPQNRPSKLQIPSMNPKSQLAKQLPNPRNPSPKIENPPSKLQNLSLKPKSLPLNPKNIPSKVDNPSPKTENPPSKLQHPSSKLPNPSLKPKIRAPQNPVTSIENTPVQPTHSHTSPVMSPSVPNQNSASSCDSNPLNRTFDRDEFQVLKSSFTISSSNNNNNNNADSLSDVSNETLHLSGSDTDTNGNRNASRKSMLSTAPASSKLGGIYQLAMKEEENLKKHVNSALLAPAQPPMNYRSLKLPTKPRGIPTLRK